MDGADYDRSWTSVEIEAIRSEMRPSRSEC